MKDRFEIIKQSTHSPDLNSFKQFAEMKINGKGHYFFQIIFWPCDALFWQLKGLNQERNVNKLKDCGKQFIQLGMACILHHNINDALFL